MAERSSPWSPASLAPCRARTRNAGSGVVVEVIAAQLRAHRLDVCGIEAHRLEVGQAPPCAEAGVQRNRATVRGHRVGGAVGGLERMAIAQPDLPLPRRARQHGFVGGDRAVEVASLPSTTARMLRSDWLPGSRSNRRSISARASRWRCRG